MKCRKLLQRETLLFVLSEWTISAVLLNLTFNFALKVAVDALKDRFSKICVKAAELWTSISGLPIGSKLENILYF